MSKEIYISSTPHETRLAIVEDDALAEIYYERENEYTLAGSIYNGKVTRVLPGMQSSFVDIGLERDAFLYITDFMEEAGDSADFEANANGGEHRAPRAEGHRDSSRREGRDRGRSDRGDRPRNAEQTDADLFTAAVTSLDPSRPERAGNSDRNRSRDRSDSWRGERNRLPRRDDSEHSAASTEPEDVIPDAPALHTAPVDSVPQESSERLGEGAPGADGSRRWRGRRGRRATRVPGRDESQSSTPAETDESSSAVDYDRLNLDASAAVPVVPITPPAPAPAPAGSPRPASNERERLSRSGERNDRNRERGSRHDRSGRGERTDRPNRSDREQTPRAPRGFAPRNLYGAAPAEDEAPLYGQEILSQAPAEPIILPGESLSKYRHAGDQPATQVAAVETTKPSPEFTLPTAWDGGLVLPGETLRRHEPRPAPQAVQPRAGTQLNTTFVPPPPMPAPVIIAKPDQEIEPAEASASFRVDRPTLLEFRQTASPVLEPEPNTVQPELLPTAPEPFTASAVEEASFADDPESPLTLDPAHQRESGPSPESRGGTHAQHVTSISATGEMYSEPVTDPVVELTGMQEVPFADPVSDPQYFSPGSGHLEEEVLDEEEEAVPSLRGSAVEVEDFEEEEALEGAADLGSMIREMSIDQITRPSSTVLEEAEEEEDFLEEDQNDASEEGGEEGGEDEEEPVAFQEGSNGQPMGFVAEERQSEQAEGTGHQETAAPQRHDGRRSERDRSRRSGGFSNNRDSSSDRPRREGRQGGGRHSAQVTNLPAISDLLKPGQELLCQIAKEPIARKGARITSHIALPGRFLVFMPTVNHTGVSRKIESDAERRRLKEILLSEKGEAAGGFIVRTAAGSATEEELRSDLRFLLNLWSDIKTRSESSKSPALIYHDLNLVERVLRDQVTDTFSAIWVDTETEYERVLRFLQRFQPSLIRRVKLYTKETPLFEQFGITEEINKALRSKVWLKSGGSIVINQTEALVAIDINTGKFVGKTARLEDTIVKTNLDAIPEIVRQIRLRDLGGIIIIDFIDMDDRKNRNRVMAALEEELKADRAPSKVLQFNDFGLVAITRKRVKQSLERTLSTTCGVCAGTGMVKSPVSVCNDIYIEMRKMQKHLDRGDVMLRVNPEVVKQLKSPGTKWLQEMEEMIGKTILVKSDPALHPEQFDIH